MPTRFAPKAATTPTTTAPIDARLLTYLRATEGDGITYAESPSAITGGFETAISSFRLAGAPPRISGPLILRLYPDEADAGRARFESAVQNAIADLGFPAPRVHITCPEAGVLGGAFVIMERAPGKPMIDAMIGPRAFGMAALLGRLHARLHALDASSVAAALSREAPGAAGVASPQDTSDLMAMVNAARLDGLRAGADWLAARRPVAAYKPVVCHGDFHPLNVMVEGRDVTGVIDWSWMHVGDPAWDVGASAALLGYAPVDLPGFLYPIMTWVRQRLVSRYLRSYSAELPIEVERVRYYEALRLLNFLMEGGYYRQAEAGIVEPMFKATPFHQAAALRAISRRFTAITGVPATLPPKAAGA